MTSTSSPTGQQCFLLSWLLNRKSRGPLRPGKLELEKFVKFLDTLGLAALQYDSWLSIGSEPTRTFSLASLLSMNKWKPPRCPEADTHAQDLLFLGVGIDTTEVLRDTCISGLFWCTNVSRTNRHPQLKGSELKQIVQTLPAFLLSTSNLMALKLLVYHKTP